MVKVIDNSVWPKIGCWACGESIDEGLKTDIPNLCVFCAYILNIDGMKNNKEVMDIIMDQADEVNLR